MEAGFTHIDTSTTFENLTAIRAACAHLPRDAVWYTVKIHG